MEEVCQYRSTGGHSFSCPEDGVFGDFPQVHRAWTANAKNCMSCCGCRAMLWSDSKTGTACIDQDMATAAYRLFRKDRQGREVSSRDGAPDRTELQCGHTDMPSESLWI